MSHPCGVYSDLFYYKSPRKAGDVVKALEGREERQGLDLRRCSIRAHLGTAHLTYLHRAGASRCAESDEGL